MNNEAEIATLRMLNRAAVKQHALNCSLQFRAGKFTRVGEDFLDEVQADVEAWERKIWSQQATSPHDPLEIGPEVSFVTGAFLERIRTDLDKFVARLIQNKVQCQPSVGKTLGRTR